MTKEYNQKSSNPNCLNPFYHRINISSSEWPWVIIGSILLAPIRIILIITLFLIASLISKLCNHWLSLIDRNEEPYLYHEWRIRFKNFVKHIFRSILFVAGFYRVTIIQRGDIEKEKDVPIYIMAPHTSLFDILAGVVLDVPSSVAKADIVDIPLFGNIFKLSDPVLVERDSQHSRQKVIKKVADVIKFSKIVFFPEGTCSNHRALLQFKNGAFKFGYPVIPVALRFNQFGGPDTLSWTWDGPNTAWSIWLTLCRWRTDLELTKLPVYTPSEQERKDPDLYAHNVAKVLVDELKMPCLFYSYDDAKYFKYRSFRSSSCVKFMKLVDKIRKMKPKLSNGTFSNGQNGSVSNHDRKDEHVDESLPSYVEYLKEFIERTLNNIDDGSNDLNDRLDMKKLLDLMNISDIDNINESYSVKELMMCFNRITFNNRYNVESPRFDAKIYHLKALCQLIDQREKNLWKRLNNAYDTFIKTDNDNNSKLTIKKLDMLLWLSLGIDNDKNNEDNDSMKYEQIEILSFEDFRQSLINDYRYALNENMPNFD